MRLIKRIVALTFLMIAPQGLDGWSGTWGETTPPRARSAGAFAESRAQVSIGGGSARFADSSYLTLQGRVSYFLYDGLSSDLGLGAWIPLDDGAPLFQVSPGVSYFFYQLMPLVPYLGGFYEYTFTSIPLESPSAIGARGGLIFAQGATLVGVGARLTRALNCEEECDLIAPELILQLSF